MTVYLVAVTREVRLVETKNVLVSIPTASTLVEKALIRSKDDTPWTLVRRVNGDPEVFVIKEMV